jgi:catechol 2,3-dioxygenase-like lactoylglutathione lyase family enzyme
LARAKAFYSKLLPLLGYRMIADERRLRFAGADGMLLVFQTTTSERCNFLGLDHIAFSVSDCEYVDQVFERAKQLGAPIIEAPCMHEDGTPTAHYAAFFADPDGLQIEVIHQPK